MAAEFKIDRIAVFAGTSRLRGNITQTVARLRSGNTGRERLFGALDQAQILRILMLADHEADGGIGNPAIDVDRQIELTKSPSFRL